MRDAREIHASILRHVRYSLGVDERRVSLPALYRATALAVRDLAVEAGLATQRRYADEGRKRVYYLSLEFLMGRALMNSIINLRLRDQFERATSEFGYSLAEICEEEPDAALGNGGLGRLAACYLDSMATLDIPGYGYGINYKYGLFEQQIYQGQQKEFPDQWSETGTPWLIEHYEEACVIPIYGKIVHGLDRKGEYNPMWLDWRVLIGVPGDMPVVGYGGEVVNFLRLYSARSSSEFDISIFSSGDYIRAVEQKVVSETVSKVLYPSDEIVEGRELRLQQEYFFVACAIRDIVRRHLRENDSLESFPERIAIQLNDTHPALAVAELMRLFIDEGDLEWERAWDLTRRTIAFTNHTLLPEALEKWPVHIFERMLPRHMQIIYEINRRFLEVIQARWPDDTGKVEQLSLIEEGSGKQVRMANLAIVGSHSVNGVAKLHTELVKTTLVPGFYDLWPERFNNKTNGITQRRWLLTANPDLADLVTAQVGDGWITDLDLLRGLEPFAEDPEFQEKFRAIKRTNKEQLAGVIRESTGVQTDPDSLFDIHVKRIHEYKRQLLNVMHVIHLYLQLVEDGKEPAHPRTFILSGKAAPGYWAAKQIIRLIHDVAEVINLDPRTKELIRMVFVPDYRVTLAESIIPAADLSEQISTAGKEASGTGNMKFALNGALTIGTLDGANIEIREEVGEQNIFIFGLRSDEIARMREENSYHPHEYLRRSPNVRRVVEALRDGRFSPGEPGRYDWIVQNLLDHGDQYFHLADFDSYVATQREAGEEYLDQALWTRKAILNVARVGRFSSDRSVREYAAEVWGVEPGGPKPPAKKKAKRKKAKKVSAKRKQA